ncbi:MAG TPA: PAS domain-containing protein, partial [Anaerolineales bacterium]|nr:PAS domain-containing protein [Anaerolineales bacterium]
MPPPPVPDNEEARLVALRRYNILDTDPDPAFDDLARLTARICQSPIALVTFVDAGRQWFKARFGFKATETHRDYSFCAHTILQSDVLVVRDAQADERFADNPLVATPPNLSFYAGAALTTSEGYAIGTLCVYDIAPRDLTPHQLDALRVLARQAMALLELRDKTLALRDSTSARELLLEETRRIEETLQNSQRFAERIAASSPNILCIYDFNQQRITYVNRDLATLGIGATDFQNMPPGSLKDLFHPEDQRPAFDSYRQLGDAPDGTIGRVEFRMRAAGGGWRWFSSHNTVFARNADGSPSQYLGVLEDINDRKQAEDALRQSEARARALLEAIPDIVFRLSPEGIFEDYKGPEARLLVPPSEFLGRHYNAVTPQLSAQITAAIERAREQGDVQTFEYTLDLPGGQTEDFEARLSVDADGHVLAVIRNITERTRSEIALHESEEKFRQLAENLQQVFWIANPDLTEILYISPGYEEVWGRSCQSVYDSPRSFLEAAHPEDRERVLAAQTRKTEGDYDVEYRIVRPDGSIRWVWSRAFPIRNQQGEVYRIVGITEDMTARKKAEQELQS